MLGVDWFLVGFCCECPLMRSKKDLRDGMAAKGVAGCLAACRRLCSSWWSVLKSRGVRPSLFVVECDIDVTDVRKKNLINIKIVIEMEMEMEMDEILDSDSNIHHITHHKETTSWKWAVRNCIVLVFQSNTCIEIQESGCHPDRLVSDSVVKRGPFLSLGQGIDQLALVGESARWSRWTMLNNGPLVEHIHADWTIPSVKSHQVDCDWYRFTSEMQHDAKTMNSLAEDREKKVIRNGAVVGVRAEQMERIELVIIIQAGSFLNRSIRISSRFQQLKTAYDIADFSGQMKWCVS